MNSCVLMARIVRAPELRYTQDNQTPISQMLVEFEGLREGEQPSTLKVVGWGNLANEIQSTYQEGDRVVIEGRLSINTIDRTEGFKEKRAELTASRIHKLTGDALENPTPRPTHDNVISINTMRSPASASESSIMGIPPTPSVEEPMIAINPSLGTSEEKDLDDIPF